MILARLPFLALAAALSACAAFPATVDPAAAPGVVAAVNATKARGLLAGEVRSPIVAAGGLNLVARGGGQVLVSNGRRLVAAGGGNVIVDNGSNVVSTQGAAIVAAGGMNGEGDRGGIVAAGGLNFRLAQVGAPDALLEVPVEGATVFLRDALTLAVVPDVAPVLTDGAGGFAIPDVPLDASYLVEAVALGDAGEGVRLAAVAPAADADARRSPVAVTVAATLVAARATQAADEKRGGIYDLAPGAVADAVQALQEQLRADRAELRQAAEGLRVRTTGAVADAAVATDYAAAEFATGAKASERAEAKAQRTRDRVAKVRHAIDPSVPAPEGDAADAPGASGGGKGDGKRPTGSPAPDASGAPTAEASPAASTKPGKPAASADAGGSPTTDAGKATGGSKGGGTSSGGSSSGGGKGGGKAK